MLVVDVLITLIRKTLIRGKTDKRLVFSKLSLFTSAVCVKVNNYSIGTASHCGIMLF